MTPSGNQQVNGGIVAQSGSGSSSGNQSLLSTGAVYNISATADQLFAGPLVSFSDANSNPVSGDFTMQIDWGAGQITPGTVTGGNGSFTVGGSHTYAVPGAYAVNVSIGGNSGNSGNESMANPANPALNRGIRCWIVSSSRLSPGSPSKTRTHLVTAHPLYNSLGAGSPA